MEVSHFLSFLAGIIVASIVLFFISKARKKEIYKVFINENGIENFLIVVAIFMFILAVLLDFEVVLWEGALASAFISFVGTFLFSFLLTKRYSKKTYEQELKQAASTAYRHNKNLLTKIEYEIKLIDQIFSQNTCENSDKHSCEYMHTLYRMRDSLIGFKRDAEENINDWSNIIPEEINAINTVITAQKKINDLEYDMSNTEDDIDMDRYKSDHIKWNAILEVNQQILDKNPIFKIILENEKKLTEEMDDLIKTEIEAKTSKNMKASRNYDNMKNYYQEFNKNSNNK